jgi:hypothetical protein
MTLVEKIINLYTELKIEDFANSITVQDDGNGQYIAKWEHPTLPRPTEEQLA